MGRHGENIRKRNDGRWEARCMVYDADKGKKVLKSVYGHSYEEAKQKRFILLNQSQNPSEAEGTDDKGWKRQMLQNLLFQTTAEEWLKAVKSRQKASTYEKYSIIYHTHLEDALGKTALGDIADSYVKKKLSEYLSDGKRADTKLSDSLQKSIYCVLNQILKYASTQYSMTLPSIPKPASNTGKKTIKVFTKAEQSRLLSALYHQMDLFKMAVLLCLVTGLRIGEICALKWSDIDFENKTLSVKSTVQRLYVEAGATRTALVETEPKTGNSIRDIPLQNFIIELLLNFQNGKEYVFGSDKPLEPRTMQNHYKKIIEEAGVSYKTFHALRHTYATNSIESGTDVKSLSDMLGHASIQITLNYYVHPTMDTKRKCADKLCGFYAAFCGQIQGMVG